MLKEFREFAMRGNVVDMAVGIIIGGAFGTIVKSLVDDVLMPPIGLALGGVDFSNFFVVLKDGNPVGPYAALAAAKDAGAVAVRYGLFVNSRHQLSHRRVRALHGDPRHESAPEGRGAAASAGHQGVQVLLRYGASKSNALPELYVTTLLIVWFFLLRLYLGARRRDRASGWSRAHWRAFALTPLPVSYAAGMRGNDPNTTQSTLGRAAGVTVMSLLIGSLASASPATAVVKVEPKKGSVALQGPLLVTATAYNSLVDQTEDDPSIAAWGDRLEPGMNAVAVSPDLEILGLKRGTKVRIEGLPGEYLVLDRMPPKWERRIDIYMGEDVHAAKHWGRRSVRIYWQAP